MSWSRSSLMGRSPRVLPPPRGGGYSINASQPPGPDIKARRAVAPPGPLRPSSGVHPPGVRCMSLKSSIAHRRHPGPGRSPGHPRGGRRPRPHGAVRGVVQGRRGVGDLPARGRGSRHRDAGRGSFGAHGPPQGRRHAGLRVLHELREPQGVGAGGEPPGRALLPLGGAGAPGAHRGPCGTRARKEESEAYFSSRASGQPHRRMGVPAEPGPALPGSRWRSGSVASRRSIPARRCRSRLSGVGTVLRPSRIEFWQGKADRLHERLVFSRDGDAWTTRRLYP